MNDSCKYIILELIPFASITGAYQYIFSDGFEAPLTSIRITNSTNIGMFISFDKVHDHEYILPGSCIELNNQACHLKSNKKSLFKKGQRVYVKQDAGVLKAGVVTVEGTYL